jgi:putative copper export protein
VLLLVTVVLAHIGAGLAWVAQTAAVDSRQPLEPDGTLLLDPAAMGRWLVYLGVCAMGGAWAVATWLLPAARARAPEGMPWPELTEDTWRLGAVVTGFVLLGAMLRGVGQLIAFTDPLEPWTAERLETVITATTWGRTWLALLTASAFAVLTGLMVRAGWSVGRPALLVATIAVAVADGTAGHGLAGTWGGVPGVSLHAAHLVGAALWLGALTVAVLVALVAPSAEDAPGRRRVLPYVLDAFAPLALSGGALVVTAGVVMGWRYAGPLGALLESEYGRTLAVKALLAVAVLALGAWHWRVAVPRWQASLSSEAQAEETAAARRVRRSVMAEVVLFAVVLLLSAILVALGAPGV